MTILSLEEVFFGGSSGETTNMASVTINLEELKSLKNDIIVGELIERTLNCELAWKKTSSTSFETSDSIFDFFLTNLGTSVILDVLKNGDNRLDLRSSSYPRLADLFNTITDIYANNCSIVDDLISLAYTESSRCGSRVWNSGSGGVVVAGLAIDQLIT